MHICYFLTSLYTIYDYDLHDLRFAVHISFHVLFHGRKLLPNFWQEISALIYNFTREITNYNANVGREISRNNKQINDQGL